MRLVNDKQNCCGCMACASVCSRGAISEYTDENGFVYPVIDENLCLNCGECTDRCAFIKSKDNFLSVKKAYAFQINDKDSLFKSTSGGAFIALSNVILEMGGVVVGAVIDDGFLVFHRLAYDQEGRNRMCGSKYVQSSTEGIFAKIQKKLEDNIPVLFSGTPCQAAQLSRYIGKEDRNLFICDFLCHGVPSNALFRDHIQYVENQYNKKAVDYLFRGKHFGWDHIEGVIFENGKAKYSKLVQAYRHFFYLNVSLRPSCMNCKYRGQHRFSDITLGDFWEAKTILGKNDKNGYSLVLTNTEKGNDLIKKAENSGKLIEIPIENILHRLSVTATKSKIDREEFFEIYRANGYEGVVEKYARSNHPERIKYAIKNAVKRIRFVLWS